MKSLDQYISEGVLDASMPKTVDRYASGIMLWKEIKGDFLIKNGLRSTEIQLEQMPVLSQNSILQIQLPPVYTPIYWDISDIKKYKDLKGLEFISTRGDRIICEAEKYEFKSEFLITTQNCGFLFKEGIRVLSNLSVISNSIIFETVPQSIRNIKLLYYGSESGSGGSLSFIWDNKFISNVAIDGNFCINATTKDIRNVTTDLFGGSININGKDRKTWADIFNIIPEEFYKNHHRSLPSYRHFEFLSEKESLVLENAILTWLKKMNWKNFKFIRITAARNLTNYSSLQRGKIIYIDRNASRKTPAELATDTKKWTLDICI